MISTELFEGQGLGNQLWCYVVTRVIAADRGYQFGIGSPERFKGHEFMNADMGLKVSGTRGHYEERRLIHPLNGSDIRIHDADLLKVSDNTRIDGYMQDELYIERRKNEIREWLRIKPEYDCRDYSADDICVINFRGGGYVYDVDFFLPRRYWDQAIAHMRRINPGFKFVVVTEDEKTAKKFFPDFEVHHWSIGKDYAVVKNAKYLILSNSSFAWFPAWLSEDLTYCIGPKYWGRHNISDGYWSLGYNLTKGWMYLDRKGDLSTYEECRRELDGYMAQNKELYSGTIPYVPSVATWIKNNAQIFKALRRDIGSMRALDRLVRARGLRLAIWVKGRIMRSTEFARRSVRKLLNARERATRNARWDAQERQMKKTWLSPNEIGEYRKKIRIYDAFTFFNEFDLLEIRLRILDPYVDRFVIVEATKTFSGHPKPLYFNENKARFKEWEHKIIHHVVDDMPESGQELRDRLKNDKALLKLDRQVIEDALSSPTVGKDAAGEPVPTWLREFYNKESIKKALAGLNDDDFCFISDLDEIWNPELIIDYSKDDIFKLRQTGYMYYLNFRSDEDEWNGWCGTIATKYKNIRDSCLTNYRGHRLMKDRYSYLENGGWHFAFQGGYEGARNKLNDYRHFWYDSERTLKVLEKRIQKGEHYRGGIKLRKDERGLPAHLLENKERYRHLFKQ